MRIQQFKKIIADKLKEIYPESFRQVVYFKMESNGENKISYRVHAIAGYNNINAKDRSTRLVVDKTHPNKVRPYTVREYARLMGVPDSFQFAGTENQQFKQIGNGVPVHLAEWIGNEANKYFN